MAKFTERYEALKNEEINDLRNALKKVGGRWTFGTDGSKEECCSGVFPCVSVNVDGHAEDVIIREVWLCNDEIEFYAEDWECAEEIDVELKDFEYGHIQYITEEITNNC